MIAETDGEGNVTATYAYDAMGHLHSMTRGGATYYYHVNGRGDVVALTDATGAVVDSYRYDPWGTVLDAQEAVANPYRYAGYRYDNDTRLYYLLNRYYSVQSYRFVTKDIYPGSTTTPATMNGYTYCLEDPINQQDPSGLRTGVTWWSTLWSFLTTALSLGTTVGGVIVPPVTLVTASHATDQEFDRWRPDKVVARAKQGSVPDQALVVNGCWTGTAYGETTETVLFSGKYTEFQLEQMVKLARGSQRDWLDVPAHIWGQAGYAP